MKRPRILSRVLDYTLFYSLLLTLAPTAYLAISLLVTLPLLFAPIEALFYFLFKTTPGKWICGLSLPKRATFTDSLKFAFKTPELVITKKHSIVQGLCIALVIISITAHFSPTSYKAEIESIAKQELTIDNWIKVKGSDAKFSVLFPKKPKLSKKKVPVEEHKTTLDVEEYTHESNVSYSLLATKLPRTWTLLGSKYLYKAMKKELIIRQGEVINAGFIKHGTHPAMEYLLQNHTGGQTKGVLVLVGKTLYKLEVEGKKDLNATELQESEAFITSFNLA